MWIQLDCFISEILRGPEPQPNQLYSAMDTLYLMVISSVGLTLVIADVSMLLLGIRTRARIRTTFSDQPTHGDTDLTGQRSSYGDIYDEVLRRELDETLQRYLTAIS